MKGLWISQQKCNRLYNKNKQTIHIVTVLNNAQLKIITELCESRNNPIATNAKKWTITKKTVNEIKVVQRDLSTPERKFQTMAPTKLNQAAYVQHQLTEAGLEKQ